MSKRRAKFDTRWISAGILLVAFIYSAVRFFIVSHQLNSVESDDSGQKTIRIAHWLLEPGVSESLQWAIDEYEQLPHVKAANVKIIQVPISERFFNQFMNVHLISGTAPDIAIKGQTELIKGNALAKFYTPISSYIGDPNPYNAPEYQEPGLPEDLSRFLAESPWKDTFFDGLQGGYEELLSDYYAIPISTWGGFRVIYNLSMLANVKDFAREQATVQPEPEWMTKMWRVPGENKGFLPKEEALSWLKTDSIPQTLGEFIFYCEAVKAYAEATGEPHLYPIAGSSYFGNNLMRQYEREFLSDYWDKLDFEPGTKLHPMEMMEGYEEGKWSMQSADIRAYFEFLRTLTSYYPNGFMGMDREQAQRRFVLGQSAIISTGAWDAQSIYSGVASRDDPADRFDIGIALKPLPSAGERWSDILRMRVSEADAKGQVPFAINKQSPHFEWALDFLKFLSSHRINEEFNERAGRLPVVIGAKPPEMVKAFQPTAEGIPQWFAMSFGSPGLPPTVKSVWSSMTKLYMTGDVDYDEVATSIDDVLRNPRIGIQRAWVTSLLTEQDKSRANDRAVSVERLNAILGSEEAAKRERSLMYLGLIEDEGVQLRHWWHMTHEGQPYPAY